MLKEVYDIVFSVECSNSVDVVDGFFGDYVWVSMCGCNIFWVFC